MLLVVIVIVAEAVNSEEVLELLREGAVAIAVFVRH